MSNLDEEFKIAAEEIALTCYKKAGIEITETLKKSIKDRAEKLLEDFKTADLKDDKEIE